METIGATEARSRLFELLREALKKNKQYRISHRDGEVIILSEDDYDSLLETLYLLSSPGFRRAFLKSRREIKKGETLPMDKVFSR